MQVEEADPSPNFSDNEIPVEFVILHYTAANLKRTLEIFSDPKRKVCAHFVLDTDGCIYDLGNFLTGPIRQGAHAGVSHFELSGVKLSAFNKMSIGIEIVNLNGNLLSYTQAQYEALTELLRHLIARFPELKQPGHILGHEDIAGFRGKCDPGVLFDWSRLMTALQLERPSAAPSVFRPEDQAFANAFLKENPNPDAETWSQLSSQLEERIKNRMSSGSL